MQSHSWRYLVQGSNSLGELGLDLRQGLGPLQGLLELLLGFIQPFLQLSVLLFALYSEKTHTHTQNDKCKTVLTCHAHVFKQFLSWGYLRHLSVQRLLAGQLILQLVFDIMERSRLPLGAEVPAFHTIKY